MNISVYKLNFLKKSLGLLNTEAPKNIYFETRFGIHTFGLKFPIDVLILDDKNFVSEVKKALYPGNIFLWNPKHKKVIELPNGFIQKNNIKKGDSIKLNFL